MQVLHRSTGKININLISPSWFLVSQFLASLIIPPADGAASLKAEQDRLLLGISNSDSGTHIKLINTVQHPERSYYLNFIIKFALPCIQPIKCGDMAASINPKRNSRWWQLWRHWSMPGKVLHHGLRRGCIKPWWIRLFVQLEGQVFYSTVETEMLIAEINVE